MQANCTTVSRKGKIGCWESQPAQLKKAHVSIRKVHVIVAVKV